MSYYQPGLLGSAPGHVVAELFSTFKTDGARLFKPRPPREDRPRLHVCDHHGCWRKPLFLLLFYLFIYLFLPVLILDLNIQNKTRLTKGFEPPTFTVVAFLNPAGRTDWALLGRSSIVQTQKNSLNQHVSKLTVWTRAACACIRAHVTLHRDPVIFWQRQKTSFPELLRGWTVEPQRRPADEQRHCSCRIWLIEDQRIDTCWFPLMVFY